MSNSNPESSRRCRPDGSAACSRRLAFTLLEVLAAVALLGILFSLLARVAVEGLRAEGDSQRRLEAVLLADEHLSDLIGAPTPPLGHHETTEGDFTVVYDVTPFALPPDWSSEETQSAAPILLASAPGSDVQALRNLTITISWTEGASERHITRTTYLLDFQAVAALAGGTTPAAAAAATTPEP